MDWILKYSITLQQLDTTRTWNCIVWQTNQRYRISQRTQKQLQELPDLQKQIFLFASTIAWKL